MLSHRKRQMANLQDEATVSKKELSNYNCNSRKVCQERYSRKVCHIGQHTGGTGGTLDTGGTVDTLDTAGTVGTLDTADTATLDTGGTAEI